MKGAEERVSARAIRKIALSASRILDKLIRLSRTGRRFARLDLRDQVGALVRQLAQEQPAGITLTYQDAVAPCPVKLDPGHLHLLLTHLVTNAQEAMPGGGTIAVKLTCEPGRCAVLEVADTGPGLDPEARARFFEPFFTTRAGAAGLGLTMVHEIVQEAGGEISVTSELGHGTVVRIELPLVAAQLGAPQVLPRATVPAPAEAPLKRGHGQAVLLAEDDDGVAGVLELQLERLGYRVHRAASGEAALALVTSGAVKPDVVLTDVMMPGMGGFKLAETLRSTRPELPVVYMTGLSNYAIAERAARVPHTAYLPKPFELACLADRVAEVLGGDGG